MLCHLVLLVFLFSWQPGRMQEGTDVGDMLQNINSNIVNLNTMIRSYVKRSEQFRVQVQNNMSLLREDLSSFNDSLSNLSTYFQKHKQQTAAELAELHASYTSLNTSLTTHTQQVNTKLITLTTSQASSHETTNLKLEAMRVTCTQLSNEIHVQTNISDVDCVTTKESLQLYRNLTNQLESIQRDVANIYGPYTCGGTGGWRRVVYLDMTDPSTTCPSGWRLTGYSKRTCGRATDGSLTCDSVTFPVSGGEYSRVCGRIKAYQWGGTDAFWSYHHGSATSIDSAYVEGVVVTYGSPRQHIWTFAAGAAEGSPGPDYVCPCDADHTIRIPPFVGNDYFCESGVNEPWDGSRHFTFHPNDTLWDGENCLSSSTCCSLNNPPYFVKQLPTPTTNDIEARICMLNGLSSNNIAIELVDLYVK